MAIPSDMVVQRSSTLDESTDESKEVVRAITRGEVDAFVISSGETEEVVLLGAADRTYRHLIDKMHQGTVNINRDGIILFANKQFAAMIGIPGSELIGSALGQYVLPESRAGLISLLEDGARKTEEITFIRSDDQAFPAQVSAELMSGEEKLFCLVISDLTDKKRHEALVSAEALGRAILEQAVDATVVCDTRGRVIRASEAAHELCGCNPLLQPFNSVFRLDSDDGKPDLDAVFGGQILRRKPFSLVRSESEQVHLLLSAGPVHDSESRVLGCVITMTDVSELRHAEEEMRRVDRSKDDFLAVLAHELRNPLAPIRSALEYLNSEGHQGPTQIHARAVIGRQVDNLVRLVDDLVDINRIRLGKIQVKRDVVDLCKVLERAVESSRPATAQRKQQLEVVLPAAPVAVRADTVRMCQVFLNLLNNAAKFTPDGGHISIRLNTDEGHAIVAVKDSGVGISAEMMPRIFDAFVQGPLPTGGSTAGLGVGLTLARRIVELHDGKIDVTSDGTNGACFVVRLPLAGDTIAEPLPVDATQARVPRRKILVVDDNVDAADTLGVLLEQSGHEVRVLYYGLDAVKTAMTFRPDVVLVDLDLPDITGHEVLMRLKESAPTRGCMAIALTGYGAHGDLQKSKDAGFDHHVVKPVEIGKLQQLLATA